jgi:uncharacterized lipoprotein YajG
MKVLVTLIGIVMLSGCTDPRAVHQNPSGITLSRVGISSEDTVFEKAQIHCEKYNKYARHTLTRVKTYTFECH